MDERMTLAGQIRRAALGPTPRAAKRGYPGAERLMSWVGEGKPWGAVWSYLPHGTSTWQGYMDNTERRMFLLFVACDIETTAQMAPTAEAKGGE